MKVVRALINGEPARSFADVRPGAELSFNDELRAGDVVHFGRDEYYRAERDPDGGVGLEPVARDGLGHPLGVPAPGFPFGEPPRDDVDGAARLFLRYEREAPLGPDQASSFIMMVVDKQAVIRRIDELRKERSDG